MEVNVTIPPARGVRDRARRMISVNVGTRERWLSALGGGALTMYGLRRRGVAGTALAALGSGLVARAATGRCAVYRALGIGAAPEALRRQQAHFEYSVTVARPHEEVYRLLHDPERAEMLLQSLGRMRVIEEHEGERIVWRSYDVGEAERTVTARLTDAPGGRGTEIELILEQAPAAGTVGRSMAKILGEGPKPRLRRALRQLKQRMEAGEVPVVEGQPSGRQAA